MLDRQTRRGRPRRRRRLLGGLALLVLVLAAAGIWLLQGRVPPVAFGTTPLAPLASVIYEDPQGGISLWDAGAGRARALLEPVTNTRKLLAANADGTAFAYLEGVMAAATPAPLAPTEYRLGVWRDDGPPRVIPVPGGLSPNVATQFLDSGDLAVLLHATSLRPGPLYIYEPDAGRLRLVAPTIDSFALAPGQVGYAAPISGTAQNFGPADRQLAVLDLTGTDPATPVVSFTVAAGTLHPVHLVWDPTHTAFVYSAARPTGATKLNTVLTLGMFGTTAPGAASALALGTNNAESALALSASGHYLLYGPARAGAFARESPGPLLPGAPLRLATLDWTAGSLRLAADRDLAPQGDPGLTGAAFLRGSDWLVLTHRRGAAGAGVALIDPAGGRQEPVLPDVDATVLAALDDHRLLLGAIFGPPRPGVVATQAPLLVLAERGGDGWKTRLLGNSFPVGTVFEFGGLLPDRAVLVHARTPGGPGAADDEALYRVPLDGTAWQVAVTLPPGGAYVPVTPP